MLIVLTGPSHSGKTVLARALLDSIEGNVALLSVDDVLERVLVGPRPRMWEQIPLAYELLEPQARTLLEQGWVVVFESTFTFVPDEGEPVFYGDALSRLLSLADGLGVASLVVQLMADAETLAVRADETGRMDARIVAGTEALHRRAVLPDGALRLTSDESEPAELAERVLARTAR